MAECTSGRDLTVLVLDEFEAQALGTFLAARALDPVVEGIYIALEG